MAELALLAFGEKKVFGIRATVRGREAVPGPRFEEPFSKRFADLSPEERANELVRLFEKHAFRPRRIHLVIPRGRALVREISVPAVPEEELPSAVRFQLEKGLPFPVEEVYFHYLSILPEEGGSRIVVACVPKKILDPTIETLRRLEIPVEGAWLTTSGLAQFAAEGDEVQLLCARFDDSLEVIATRGRTILADANTSGFDPGEGADHLNRALVFVLSKLGDARAGKVQIWAAEEGWEAGLPAGIAAERRAPPGERVPDSFLPMLGVASGLARGNGGMRNLLVPPQAKGRLPVGRWARVGAMLGLAAGVALVWGMVSASDKEATRDRLRADVEKKREQLQKHQHTWEDHALLESHGAGRLVWPEVLQAIASMIDPKALYLTRAELKGDGTILLRGMCRDENDGRALADRLKQAPRFRDVSAPRFTPREKGGRAFPVEFDLSARVEPPKGAKP